MSRAIAAVFAAAVLVIPAQVVAKHPAEERGAPRYNVTYGHLKASATQSSTANKGLASRAIDGNTSTHWQGNSIAHTGAEKNPWLDITLGASFPINEIEVWSRSDACKGCVHILLPAFWVFVSDKPFSSKKPEDLLKDSGVSATFIRTSPPRSRVAVTIDRPGRYVRIQRADYGSLAIAEVQVWSTKPNIDPSVPATKP